jgi:hypothetical protein
MIVFDQALILNLSGSHNLADQSYQQAAGGVAVMLEEELLTFRAFPISGSLKSFTYASRRSSVRWCGSFFGPVRNLADICRSFNGIFLSHRT